VVTVLVVLVEAVFVGVGFFCAIATVYQIKEAEKCYNRGMELLAHEMVTRQTFGGKLTDFVQKPVVAVILVTIIVLLLMFWAVYLLKRHTDWKFPYNPQQGDK
jgi:hypothetical protein